MLFIMRKEGMDGITVDVNKVVCIQIGYASEMDVFGQDAHGGDFHVYGSELTIYIESDDGTLEAFCFDIKLREEGLDTLLDMLQKIRKAKNGTTPEAENPKFTEEQQTSVS